MTYGFNISFIEVRKQSNGKDVYYFDEENFNKRINDLAAQLESDNDRESSSLTLRSLSRPATLRQAGELMQQAYPLGYGMTAIIGLDLATVEGLLAQVHGDDTPVYLANINADNQVVIAGSDGAMKAVAELAKVNGAGLARRLAVSVPSHCEMMRPAAERFAESIAAIDWQAPQIPLVQNVSAAVAADLPTLKRDLLEQLYKPVRWVESVQALAATGPVDLVECGPGKVLVGISKRCAEGVTTHNLNTPDAFAAARLALV